MLIGYMRVSTDKERQTTDLQKDALLKEGVDKRHLYVDYASGIKDTRSGLMAALNYLHKGDCLVVWKLDRLGRSLSELLKIIKSLKEKEIGFKSLTENIDTTTPQGELYFHIFASLAQYERSLIRERIMAGLEAAHKRGRRGGRPKKIDSEKLEMVLKALEAGNSKASVARTFHLSRKTLYNYLEKNVKESVIEDLKDELIA